MLKKIYVFLSGSVIGILGGLIGLGGAEFRLPVLIGLFKFPPLEAVILNKIMSLIVVISAFIFRAVTIPYSTVFSHWDIIINILAGSIAGAWIGADIAVKLRVKTFYRIISFMLIVIACILFISHNIEYSNFIINTNKYVIILLGIVSGFIIGLFAAILGVAGGELIIPVLILLFGIDIKLAGSLSLAISMPTMITGLIRYTKDDSFKIVYSHKSFILIMASGSILGAFLGGLLLGIVSESILIPLLVIILFISSYKIWTHK